MKRQTHTVQHLGWYANKWNHIMYQDTGDNIG
jgi:hypothetical protein